MLTIVNVKTVYNERSCFVLSFALIISISICILTILKHRKRDRNKQNAWFSLQVKKGLFQSFIQFNFPHFCPSLSHHIIIRNDLSTGISFNFMKFVCLILCYILYVFYWT